MLGKRWKSDEEGGNRTKSGYKKKENGRQWKYYNIKRKEKWKKVVIKHESKILSFSSHVCSYGQWQ
jgi:hypothetical protein